jgi:hypothetical protein
LKTARPKTKAYEATVILKSRKPVLGLLFIPEDGGNMFLRNAGWLSPDYTALYPRR